MRVWVGEQRVMTWEMICDLALPFITCSTSKVLIQSKLPKETAKMLPRTSQARKRAKEYGNAYGHEKMGCPLPCSSQGALRASKLLSQGLPCTRGLKG